MSISFGSMKSAFVGRGHQGAQKVTAANDDALERDAKKSLVLEEPASGKTLDRMQRYAKDTLALGAEKTRFICHLFSDDYYLKKTGLKITQHQELFEHYCTEGFKNNISPSPFFDTNYVKQTLEAHLGRVVDLGSESLMNLWLEHLYDATAPISWFDTEFYYQHCPDVKEHGFNAFQHFILHGMDEGRIPTAHMLNVVNQALTHFPERAISIRKIATTVPSDYVGDYFSGQSYDDQLSLMMPELYKVGHNINDADITPSSLLAHFICHGSSKEKRLSALFNTEFYNQQLQNIAVNDATSDLESVGSSNAWLHWFYVGRKNSIVPTPLFSKEHYLASHGDIKQAWKREPFEHYLQNGHNEGGRSASVHFDANYYRHVNRKRLHTSFVLDYVMVGQFMPVAPSAGIHIDHFKSDDPYQCTPAEKAAIHVLSKAQRLKTGVLADMVARIDKLEPMIVRPYGVKKFRMAPSFHPEVDLMLDARNAVSGLQKKQYDTIVLIPHCRMAGSAKIAGKFTQMLARIGSGEDILVIITDMSVFERPDWFPDNVDLYDFSQYVEGAPEDRRVRTLLDIVRGLRAKRLINVNSNFGWRLSTMYGRQLSEWMDLYFYLFCWDLDVKGNKGGYPIQWFLPTFDYCKAVFTDSKFLRDELQDRYCVTDEQRMKLQTLHTPAEDTEINYHDALVQRNNLKSVKRVFWSGRFDRQKRTDILLAVAKAMPDVEFWVWGKPVLNDSKNHLLDAPGNVRLMGHYSSIDDVPIASCDCFLYTAEWDGLPTVLIEVGSRSIPVVASAVGGVTDLIKPSTGWPVVDFDNSEAYVDALNEVLNDYPAALDKGKALRQHTLAVCNDDLYQEQLSAVLTATGERYV